MRNALLSFSWMPFLALLLFTAQPAETPVPATNEATSYEATSYEVDKSHSEVGFKVRHLGIANVRGSFGDYEATLAMDGNDLSTLTATATIQVASIAWMIGMP